MRERKVRAQSEAPGLSRLDTPMTRQIDALRERDGVRRRREGATSAAATA